MQWQSTLIIITIIFQCETSPLHASRLLSYSSDGVLMVLKRLLQLLGKLALGVNVTQESRELRHGGRHPATGPWSFFCNIRAVKSTELEDLELALIT
jgi:hypothetical protein